MRRFMRTALPGLTALLVLLVLAGCSNPYTTKATITPIYAATSNGLSLSIDGGQTWTNYLPPVIAGPNVSDVAVSGSGSSATIYVATGSGVSVYDGISKTWSNSTTVNSLPSNTVYAVTYSGSYIYAGTSGGFALSSDGGASWSPIPSGSTAPGTGTTVNDVFISVVPYVATTNGLYLLTLGGWTNFTTGGPNSIPSSTVNKVFVDQSGYIYVGTSSGLGISADGGSTWQTISTSNSTLPGNNILSLFVDSYGYIYVGTSGGLSISPDGGSTWTTFTTADGLGGNTVKGIDVINDSIYLATSGGVSVSLDFGKTWTTYTTVNGLGSDTVNGIYVTEPLYSF